ncbi:MAG TPA: DUF354 domain-containing protein [Candidatus Dormibacteraeota bacterium]|nr:DUF354 domain-containing protein [Candidatus Dormibacteraeota bacterium]
MRIWIDLANTPHVLFFEPIIRELERRGHSVVLTARRFANTLELVRARGIQAQPIGAGHDASRDEHLKQVEHRSRTAQLVAFARQGFDLAASHVSYTQASAARRLGIPTFATIDYEHRGLRAFRDARCLMVPSVIPPARLEECGVPARIVRHYDGLKEHVYLAGFRPVPNLRARLGIAAEQPLVTFRPIADHAVYTDDSGDGVQRRLVEHLAAEPGVCVLVLPRTASQRLEYESLARRLPAIRTLREAIDGPSLICASDLVVCGGGTMLREAAVLGVPAVSVFSGALGAVDRWLAGEGRVTLVRSDEEARRIRIERRPPHVPREVSGVALAQIVQGICDTGEGR